VLLQALACEDLRIVLEDGSRVFGGRANGPVLRLDLVRSEHNALAEEMGEHVIDADELDLPLEGVQDVSLLVDELIIRVWDANKVEELINAWVGLFKILG
jgi:hypothetical protein